MMSLGVYHKLEHVITNTTLREYLADTYIIDIDKKIEKEYLPPFRFKKDTMDDRSRKFVSVLDNEDSICEIEITPTKAYHNDYSEESDSFGKNDLQLTETIHIMSDLIFLLNTQPL